MSVDLSPGRPFPDIELADHASSPRRLSELTAGDPVAVSYTHLTLPTNREV